MKTIVYLIEIKDDNELMYKIGWCKKNVKNRIKTLQTGCVGSMVIVDIYYTKHGKKLEGVLHRIFSHYRYRGEFFKLNIKDVVEFIDMCNKIEKNLDLLDEKI